MHTRVQKWGPEMSKTYIVHGLLKSVVNFGTFSGPNFFHTTQKPLWQPRNAIYGQTIAETKVCGAKDLAKRSTLEILPFMGLK